MFQPLKPMRGKRRKVGEPERFRLCGLGGGFPPEILRDGKAAQRLEARPVPFQRAVERGAAGLLGGGGHAQSSCRAPSGSKNGIFATVAFTMRAPSTRISILVPGSLWSGAT